MHNSFKILLPTLVFVCLSNAAVFKFTNFVCENYAKTYLVVEECRIRAISREKNVVNFNLSLLQAVPYVLVEAQIYKRGASLGYQPWLYKFDIDACRFLKRPYHPVAMLVYGLFHDFSNINHTCPYKDSVIVKGFHLRLGKLPHAIPTGDYLLNVSWVITNDSHLLTKAYYSFKEDL